MWRLLLYSVVHGSYNSSCFAMNTCLFQAHQLLLYDIRYLHRGNVDLAAVLAFAIES